MTSSSENETEPSIQDVNSSAVESAPSSSEPGFGWTTYAETTNGRFAMIGLLILLALEWFSHQDLFTWLGLR